jgi:hypothetical protein
VTTVTSDRITVITGVVSAAIQAFRKREGLTRAEFAERAWELGAPADFTATVVGALETGRRSAAGRRREIMVDELVFLAKVMGMSPLAVLGDQAVVFTGDKPAPECARCASKEGPVLQQVRTDIETLPELAGVDPSLAQTAYVLAAAVDAGTGDARLLPRLTKELRATLEQIVASRPPEEAPDPDDDLDDLGIPE